MPSLILASQSPRRKELLSSLGVEFSARPADIDETPFEGEASHDYVLRMAIEKAETIFDQLTEQQDILVLGSDTTVVADGEILAKPEDFQDFKRMMALLSGRTHQTITAVAIATSKGLLQEVVTTEVSFMPLQARQIEAYWETGEPQDKAGGYGIQGKGGIFVSSINGSFSAVVGLPLHETAKLLVRAGMPLWQGKLSL